MDTTLPAVFRQPAVEVLRDGHGALSPEVAVDTGGIVGWGHLGDGFHSLLHIAGSLTFIIHRPAGSILHVPSGQV